MLFNATLDLEVGTYTHTSTVCSLPFQLLMSVLSNVLYMASLEAQITPFFKLFLFQRGTARESASGCCVLQTVAYEVTLSHP